jgi:CBS domain-containing protein
MATVIDVLQYKGSLVLGIHGDRTVFEAIGEMTQNNVGALVVWDPTGLPVGILTERDYLRRIALMGRSSKSTRVDEIMSAPLVSVSPKTDLSECMCIMTEQRVRHLVVIASDESLCGLVSIGDLVKYELRERGDLIDEMLNYIGTYPPESARPSSAKDVGQAS